MDTGDISEELNLSALSLTNAKKQGFLNLGRPLRRKTGKNGGSFYKANICITF